MIGDVVIGGVLTGDMLAQLASLVAVAGLVVAGLVRAHRQAARRRSWVPTRGRVRDERSPGELPGWRISDAVVEFTTLDGLDVSGVPVNASPLGRISAGRSVPVWYDPRDPLRFEAVLPGGGRCGLVLFTVAGAVVAALVLASVL